MDIVIDCDDVLINMRDCMFPALHKKYGINLSQTLTYKLHETLNITIEEFFETLIEQKVIEKTIVDPHAKFLITALRELGYRPHLVTARGWHPNAYDITLNELKRNDIELDSYHFINPDECKAEYIKNTWGKVFCIIDDNYNHSSNCVSSRAAKLAILPERPWNVNYKNYDYSLEWVKDLTEAVSLIKEVYHKSLFGVNYV